MAKRRAVKKDQFVNRVRGSIQLAAAGGGSVESFNTGMNVGREDPMKWVILGGFLQWDINRNSAFCDLAGQDNHLAMQLCIGTQTGILDADDMQVVGTGQTQTELVTQGGMSSSQVIARLEIPYPIPVFASVLTVVAYSANIATLNSKYCYYEIQYLRAGISQNEIVEYLAAFGQV